MALFLGPYLTALAKAAADSAGFVHPLGLKVDARSYWSYAVSLSVILQVLVLPIVGAIADYGSRKKQCLAATAYLGAASAIAMYWLRDGDYLWGGALFIVANVSFGASVVIYNSFLPEIAPPEQRDAVSSKGWGIGYIGGGVLLALNLLLFMSAARLGISGSDWQCASIWLPPESGGPSSPFPRCLLCAIAPRIMRSRAAGAPVGEPCSASCVILSPIFAGVPKL